MTNKLEEALRSRVTGATDLCEAVWALAYDVPAMVMLFMAGSTGN